MVEAKAGQMCSKSVGRRAEVDAVDCSSGYFVFRFSFSLRTIERGVWEFGYGSL
jgi:hypothetical protein